MLVREGIRNTLGCLAAAKSGLARLKPYRHSEFRKRLTYTDMRLHDSTAHFHLLSLKIVSIQSSKLCAVEKLYCRIGSIPVEW